MTHQFMKAEEQSLAKTYHYTQESTPNEESLAEDLLAERDFDFEHINYSTNPASDECRNDEVLLEVNFPERKAIDGEFGNYKWWCDKSTDHGKGMLEAHNEREQKR